jgi:hypothetical protein
VEHIFDDLQVEADGRQTGGTGKQKMYNKGSAMILKKLEFEKSPPFTDLIRGLFLLFRSLDTANQDKDKDREPRNEDAANVKKLENCTAIIQLMKKAVESEGWPEVCDKVANGNYPRDEKTDEKDRVGLANLKEVTPPAPDAPVPAAPTPTTGTSRTSKRGREEDDGPATPTKRSKVEPV